jgi:30S ribosomal protein S31
MGKGDRKSKRGKITLGSYGKSRPKAKKKAAAKKDEKKS